MNRNLKYKITTEDDGKAISAFLKERGFSELLLTAFRNDESYIISVNDEPVLLKRVLAAGDQLFVHIDEKAPSEMVVPVKLPFEVVYEDEDIAVVNKPAGMPIHPSRQNWEQTLGNAAAYYYKDADGYFVYRCINRLDKGTSGLTVIAKNALSGGILYEAIKSRGISRTYFAIVEEDGLPDEGTINMPIGRADKSIITRCVDYENGKNAVTHFKVVERKDGLALVKLNLETGRTHQIRVHMSAIGHPLIGDYIYNESDTRMDRPALHAGKIILTHPITGEELEFSVPLPEDMQRFFTEYLV